MSTEKKKCNLCKHEQDSDLFINNGGKIVKTCSPCRAKMRQYYKENKVKITANRKNYYKENKAEISVQRKNYYRENRVEIIEKIKKYWGNHKFERSEYMKLYHKNNKCFHGKYICHCKICNDALKVTVKNILSTSKASDKKYERYQPDDFIDITFVTELLTQYTHCFYPECNIKLQYMKYADDMATIERINNNIGHTKDNCVICCRKCNFIRKSNHTTH